MKKYKILDLYCCAGGAGEGYHRAGFEVFGIDNQEQPNYPYEMQIYDAIKYLKKYGHQYDAVHASPPCQAYSCSTAIMRKKGKTYPDNIKELREELDKLGKPYIIENVSNAPVRHDIVLYGYMFGLKVIRKRVFELGNWFCMQPHRPVLRGTVNKGDFVSVYGKAKWANTDNSSKRKNYIKPTWRKKTILETWKFAMGIDRKITDKEISESIPPAYTEYLGKELINYLNKI